MALLNIWVWCANFSPTLGFCNSCRAKNRKYMRLCLKMWGWRKTKREGEQLRVKIANRRCRPRGRDKKVKKMVGGVWLQSLKPDVAAPSQVEDAGQRISPQHHQQASCSPALPPPMAFIFRIIYSGLACVHPPTLNPPSPIPTPALHQDLTRGHFNNEDGLTAIESAHKLELQPTSMSNLPSS